MGKFDNGGKKLGRVVLSALVGEAAVGDLKVSEKSHGRVGLQEVLRGLLRPVEKEAAPGRADPEGDRDQRVRGPPERKRARALTKMPAPFYAASVRRYSDAATGLPAAFPVAPPPPLVLENWPDGGGNPGNPEIVRPKSTGLVEEEMAERGGRFLLRGEEGWLCAEGARDAALARIRNGFVTYYTSGPHAQERAADETGCWVRTKHEDEDGQVEKLKPTAAELLAALGGYRVFTRGMARAGLRFVCFRTYYTLDARHLPPGIRLVTLTGADGRLASSLNIDGVVIDEENGRLYILDYVYHNRNAPALEAGGADEDEYVADAQQITDAVWLNILKAKQVVQARRVAALTNPAVRVDDVVKGAGRGQLDGCVTAHIFRNAVVFERHPVHIQLT